jgi:hypothetical protein
MAILWWPIIIILDATDAGDAEMIPKMIGDSVQLLLVIALGYGLFLLARKHIKPWSEVWCRVFSGSASSASRVQLLLNLFHPSTTFRC